MLNSTTATAPADTAAPPPGARRVAFDNLVDLIGRPALVDPANSVPPPGNTGPPLPIDKTFQKLYQPWHESFLQVD